MTRIAIISDLHLGVGEMNRCSADRDELLGFLDSLDEQADEIVVAGDVFDLSRPPRLLGWRRYLRDIRRQHPDVVARLESYRWIFGNHDRWMSLHGVPERIEYVLDGFRLLIIHGHQFDLGLKQIRPLETAANFFAGWSIRLGFESIAEMMHDVPIALERASEGDHPLQTLAARGAQTLVDQGDWNVVAMGHSHALRLVRLGHDSVLASTGSLTDGHLDYVLVDTEERSVTSFRDGDRIDRISIDD